MKPEETRKLIETAENSEKTYVGTKTSILGVEEDVSVEDQHRVKHVLTTGANGTGKTQELLHVALQDSVKGYGLAVVNPKGSLIDEYLAKLPEDRYNDLVYLNPSREPITGINVLEPYVNSSASIAAKANQIELIVSNLIQLFKRRSNNWGDRFGRVFATLLRAGISANIEYQEGYTLRDIKHCATDNEELKQLIGDTGDPEIRRELVNIKDNLTDRELEPLVRRLNDFTGNRTVRHVISSETSDIDFQKLVNQGKILLVDSREGEVGNTVTELLSSIVITKLWAAAQNRYYQQNEVKPFYLFVDELQTFPTEGTHFAEILSKAREYRLGCWLATQYLSQLPREMRNAVQNNCRTKLVFSPSGSEDLPKLNRMLRGIKKEQIDALGDYRAIIQTPGTHQRREATVIDTYRPWKEEADLQQLKKQGSPATKTSYSQTPVLGKGVNAGGEKHTELLTEAKEILEERGFQVKLPYQDSGDDKPDGYVKMPDGSTAHLEAEHTTLSKPGKVLENLRRAVEKGRETIFIVEKGNANKLGNILSDPVNRKGSEHQDQDGSYRYYRLNGEPFTQLDWIDKADYRVLEVVEDDNRLFQGREEQNLQSKSSGLEELSDRERTVLNCIKNGKDDTQKITSHTGLHRDKVTYSLRKLEKRGWIQINTPEEPVERVIDGQKHVFQVKTAELTPKAEDKV